MSELFNSSSCVPVDTTFPLSITNILLDEPTSSLDSETENKIQLALKKLTENKTTIVIAHRLSTILSANKIFVIDNGNVVSTGTHSELLNSSEIYNNFYNKQIKNN